MHEVKKHLVKSNRIDQWTLFLNIARWNLAMCELL